MSIKQAIISIILILSSSSIFSQGVINEVNIENASNLEKTIFLSIPKRPENAIDASEFVKNIAELGTGEREKIIVQEIELGNVPSFGRQLIPLKIVETINEKKYELIFYASNDYLAVGSDADYMYVPMTPSTAQSIADKFNCLLPTQKLVDIIYAQAKIKLRPQPIPPSDEMTSIPIFWQHTDSLKQQLFERGINRTSDKILAGHKKDVIISSKIYDRNKTSGSVVIYGWHNGENNPIQPVYSGHGATYADYSHGIRLVSQNAFLNGEPMKLETILNNSALCSLISDEGEIPKPYYPIR